MYILKIDMFLNFQDQLDVNLKIHAKGGLTGGSTEERTDRFFAEIPKPLILQLYEYCRRDYEMFGYPSPYKYM